MTARRMVQVIRPPVCDTCGVRCGHVDHYASHWLESCRRKVTYLSPTAAIQHASEIWPAFVYECPLKPQQHFHVASGVFRGWHRANRKRRVG